MISDRLPIIKYMVILLMLVIPGRTAAQNTTVLDTSEYLPLFYDGALEYNLMIAASNGYYTEVERLILMGAEVDAKTSDGATALIFAVINNSLITVKTLIRYNADVNQKTGNFETPLLIATKNEDLEIAEVLIRYGADVDFHDRYGATPLHYASIYGFFYIADLLIYYKADIDKKAYDGTTPLMAAIWAGHQDVADLLIQNGANMEARDEEGFTPFLVAAQNGDTLMLNLLRKKGADIYERNLYKWNALSLAIKSDQKEAAEMLLKDGDKWVDNEKETINPYYVAMRYRRKDILDLLDKYNFPSKYKRQFDQVMLSLSGRFTLTDFLSGFSFRFKEPYTNFGFTTGVDAKLWYTKVLRKENDHLYMQYLDKSYVVYAGVFKDYQLTDNIFGSNFFFTGSLSAAYSFGNEFKGTTAAAAKKIRIMPAISLKWSKGNFSIFTGAEYLKTDFYRNGPLWARVGCSYNLLFDYIKDRGKDIKWY
jgi:ankyrin repeat protein